MIINALVIFFVLLGIKSIIFDKNGIENSLQWIILAFVLGYRTFEPVLGLKIHPIEIFIFASVIRIIISDAVKYRKMSKSILILGIIFFVYFFIDLLTRYNSYVLLEFKNAFILLLIFFLTQYDFHQSVYENQFEFYFYGLPIS